MLFESPKPGAEGVRPASPAPGKPTSDLQLQSILLNFKDTSDELLYRKQSLSAAAMKIKMMALLSIAAMWVSATDAFATGWVVALVICLRLLPLLCLAGVAFMALGRAAAFWSYLAAFCLTLSTSTIHFLARWCLESDSLATDMWSCDAMVNRTVPWQSTALLLTLPIVLSFGFNASWYATLFAYVAGFCIHAVLVLPKVDGESLPAAILTPVVWGIMACAMAFFSEKAARLAWKSNAAAQRKLLSLVNANISRVVLQEQGQRLSQLLKRSQLMISEVSASGMFLYVSPAVKAFMGRDAEELVQADCCMHVHHEYADGLRTALSHLAHGVPMSGSQDRTPKLPGGTFENGDGDVPVGDEGFVTGPSRARSQLPLTLYATFPRRSRDDNFVWVEAEGHLIPAYQPPGVSSRRQKPMPTILLIERKRAVPPPSGTGYIELVTDTSIRPRVDMGPAVAAASPNTSATLATASTGTPAQPPVPSGSQSVRSPAGKPRPVSVQSPTSPHSDMKTLVLTSGADSRTVGPSSPTRSSKPTPPTAVGPKEPGTRGNKYGVSGLHVLFVDDDPVNRRLGARMLDRLGCTVTVLEDGDEVSGALVGSKTFDAILMDIVMQRSDGAAVCQALRDTGVSLPIVAMTGTTGNRDVQRFLAHGFDVVLPKPFDIRAMGRALAEGRNRRQLMNTAGEVIVPAGVSTAAVVPVDTGAGVGAGAGSGSAAGAKGPAAMTPSNNDLESGPAASPAPGVVPGTPPAP